MANRYIDKNAGDDVYKYIMELVPQTDDLNIFLQKIYMRYNMPVIVTDIAFHLIAYGGPYPCPDPLWQALITTGAAAPETVIDYYFGEGFTDKMSAAGEPIDVTWGVNIEYPRHARCIWATALKAAARSCIMSGKSWILHSSSTVQSRPRLRYTSAARCVASPWALRPTG